MAPTTVSAIDLLAEMWRRVEAARAKLQAARPPGSFTYTEYARRYNIGDTTARRQLNDLIDGGAITRVKATVINEDGRSEKRWYYMPVEP